MAALLGLVLSNPIWGAAATPDSADAGRPKKLLVTSTPQAPDDLKLSGSWAGLADGEVGYITRAALAALPAAHTVRDRAWKSMPEVDLTVLPLAALIEALDAADDADGLVLTCDDRWESWLPLSLIADKDPYLLLYYDGKSPTDHDAWPTFAGIEPMAPYYVFVSPARFPEWEDVTPFGMISATQVVEITAANESTRFAPFYAGKLAELASPAQHGRELFLANCNTCHQGPELVGGNVSQRPFVVLQTHAAFNEAFFRNMVKNPKSVYPETIMPAHTHLSEGDLDDLVAFLKASR